VVIRTESVRIRTLSERCTDAVSLFGGGMPSVVVDDLAHAAAIAVTPASNIVRAIMSSSAE
jgi:hypothetical protein